MYYYIFSLFSQQDKQQWYNIRQKGNRQQQRTNAAAAAKAAETFLEIQSWFAAFTFLKLERVVD